MTRARSSQRNAEKEVRVVDLQVFKGARRHSVMFNARFQYTSLVDIIGCKSTKDSMYLDSQAPCVEVSVL